MMVLNSAALLAMLNFIPSYSSNTLTLLGHRQIVKQDQTALDYSKAHKNTYILVVFPMSNQDDDKEILKIAQNYGKIIHTKKLYFSEEKAVKFMRLLYLGHGKHLGKWLGTPENNFKGARHAVKERFSNSNIPLRVYLYESDSLLAVQKCKFMLRKSLNSGRDAIHANDTHEETLKLAKFLFDKKYQHS